MRHTHNVDRHMLLAGIVFCAGCHTLRVSVLSPSRLGTNPFHIDLSVVAPRSLALDCCTEVGDIRIAGCDKQTRARTNVGDIVIAGLRAATDLHTDVGDIRVVCEPNAPPALDAKMLTGVGTIDLTGPAHMSAVLGASVHRGAIHIDQRLGIAGPLGRSVKISLGDADGHVELRATQRGGVEIR